MTQEIARSFHEAMKTESTKETRRTDMRNSMNTFRWGHMTRHPDMSSFKKNKFKKRASIHYNIYICNKNGFVFIQTHSAIKNKPKGTTRRNKCSQDKRKHIQTAIAKPRKEIAPTDGMNTNRQGQKSIRTRHERGERCPCIFKYFISFDPFSIFT